MAREPQTFFVSFPRGTPGEPVFDYSGVIPGDILLTYADDGLFAAMRVNAILSENGRRPWVSLLRTLARPVPLNELEILNAGPPGFLQKIENRNLPGILEAAEAADPGFIEWFQTPVWIVTGSDDDDRQLTKKRPGDIFQWAVPQGSRQQDMVLFYVSGKSRYGFGYVMRIVSVPRPAEQDEYGPFQARLKVIFHLKHRITFKMLKEHEVLSTWVALANNRNMQGLITGQKGLLDDPRIWPALKSLIVDRNPDLIDRLGSGGATVRGNFIHDLPSEVDYLNYWPTVLALNNFLRSGKTRFPLALAIDAPWGVGKSSVMKMLQKKLEDPDENKSGEDPGISIADIHEVLKSTGRHSSNGEETKAAGGGQSTERSADQSADQSPKLRKFETVFVNAWRHGTGTKLTASLVRLITEKVTNQWTRREQEHFWARLNLARVDRDKLRLAIYGKLFGILLAIPLATAATAGWLVNLWMEWWWGGLTGLGLFIAMSGLGLQFYNSITNGGKRLSFDFSKYLSAPDYDKLTGSQMQIEKDFRAMMAEIKARGKSLAIFIDDLDRCSPGAIAQFVETINVFFAQEVGNCVFVLGLHRDLVAASLEIAYKELADRVIDIESLEEERPFGQRFLEKIVQFVIYLPRPDSGVLDRYARFLIDDKRAPDPVLEEVSADQNESDTNASEVANANAATEAAATPVENRVDIHEGVRQNQSAFEEAAREALGDEDELVPRLSRVFGVVRHFLRANPRQYVRCLNGIRFEHQLLRISRQRTISESELLDLARRVVVDMEWPELRRSLERDPDLWKDLIRNAADGEFSADLRNRLPQAPAGGSMNPDRLRELLSAEIAQ